MNTLLSHFQISTKQVGAFIIAFTAYIQSLGHFPETGKEWGVAIGGFILSTLVPARGAGAKQVPSPGPTDSP